MMEKSLSPDMMTGLIIRINSLEQQSQQVQTQLQQVHTQLQSYVPASMHDLQLQSIRSSVDRIEHDVGEMKRQFNELNTELTTQRENQDKLQIRVLWGIVSLVITVLTAVLIGYLTHLIK